MRWKGIGRVGGEGAATASFAADSSSGGGTAAD